VCWLVTSFMYLLIYSPVFVHYVFTSDDFNTSRMKAAVFEAAFLSIPVERFSKLVPTLNQNSLFRVERNLKALYLMTSLFWNVTQRYLIVSLFGTIYWSHLQGSGTPRPIRYPETSVSNYRSALCDVPEERRPHLHRGRSLKSQARTCF